MRIGSVVVSILVRVTIFWFVAASLLPAARNQRGRETAPSLSAPMRDAGSLASFSRAGIGFVASLAIAIMLMVALGATGTAWPPVGSAIGLRGSI